MVCSFLYQIKYKVIQLFINIRRNKWKWAFFGKQMICKNKVQLYEELKLKIRFSRIDKIENALVINIQSFMKLQKVKSNWNS
jgi:hypothetical protein